MDNSKKPSLDDTLKEILNEDNLEDKDKSIDKEDKPKRTRRTKAQIEADEKAKIESDVKLEPEIVADTSLDNNPDIISVEDTLIEQSKPEIVPDTILDQIPDIDDTPELKSKNEKIIHPRGEAIEAFNSESSEISKEGWIGKEFILVQSTPMFRAKHLSMQIKSYRGLVKIIEEPSDGFVKVQFLRQGFGLCESYTLLVYLQSIEAETSIEN